MADTHVLSTNFNFQAAKKAEREKLAKLKRQQLEEDLRRHYQEVKETESKKSKPEPNSESVPVLNAAMSFPEFDDLALPDSKLRATIYEGLEEREKANFRVKYFLKLNDYGF